MALQCKLNPQAISEINAACRDHIKSLTPGAVIGWFTTAGALLSTYLPDFLEVLKALTSVTGTAPTVGMFFRKGAEMFQDSPEPDIATPDTPEGKPAWAE